MYMLSPKTKRFSIADRKQSGSTKENGGPGILTRLFTLGKKVLALPPPTLGDGLRRGEAVPNIHETGFIQDIISQGGRIPADFEVALLLLWSQTAQSGLVDDRTYFMEKIIQLIASLPSTSKLQVQLTSTLINKLWITLQHPPLTYLGSAFKYRMADGSNNNIMYPHLGKAGTPYARSVMRKILLPANLPDAGVLFDTLYAREEFVPHPTKISSMLFYLATIIIHDIFKTNPCNPNISDTSSYLDLAPLYGNNDTELQSIRLGSDGLLKADAFCERRVLGFPPGVSALLVCFNRFHNYAAVQLSLINENGKFTKPVLAECSTETQKKEFGEALCKYDEEIFQTARLITTGLYVNIVLNDYVKTILNFNRTKSTWTLDPRSDFDQVYDKSVGTPIGIGNQCSVEFNLIYRWHACVSERDAVWTKDFYRGNFGVDAEKLTTEELKNLMHAFAKSIPTDPGERTFGGLHRQSELGGRFKDEDLAKILIESTEDLAGSFGAKHIPRVLRAVEILGIEQARYWDVASLNEFRQFCGLEPHKSFEDINSDPEVAKALRCFYDHPDFVELYPGLMAEEAKKPMVPGSGLCASFTISRAILSDAVALVRGDRFYTTDYSPTTLTNWGYATVSSVPDIVQGRVIYKLLQRALPTTYRFNSVYAMFPFTIPSENEIILHELGIAANFDFSQPVAERPAKSVTSYSAIKDILTDTRTYRVPWGRHIYELTGEQFMLGGDGLENALQKKQAVEAFYNPRNALDEIRVWWEDTLTKMLKEKAYKLEDYFQVDVVRDIGNCAQARFSAEMFNLPLKTQENPRGIFTEQEFYLINAVCFAYVFLDADPAQSFALRQTAKELVSQMTPVVAAICHYVQTGEVLDHVKEFIHIKDPPSALPSFGKQLIKRLLANGDPYTEPKSSSPTTVGRIFEPILAAGSVQAQAFAQMLDVLLSDEYYHHWGDIQKLALNPSPEAFKKLRKYALEGMRLDPPASGVIRVVVADAATISDGANLTQVNHGDRLLLNFVTAANDESVFPNPRKLDINRPEKDYILYGYGAHDCLGKELSITALTATLRVFGQLKNLRRAPGPQGKLKYIINPSLSPGRIYLKEDNSASWPFPASMRIAFDRH